MSKALSWMKKSYWRDPTNQETPISEFIIAVEMAKTRKEACKIMGDKFPRRIWSCEGHYPVFSAIPNKNYWYFKVIGIL